MCLNIVYADDNFRPKKKKNLSMNFTVTNATQLTEIQRWRNESVGGIIVIVGPLLDKAD